MSNDNIKTDLAWLSDQAGQAWLSDGMDANYKLTYKKKPWQQTYFVVDCSHHCSHGVYAD